jgi:hypothetical protein
MLSIYCDLENTGIFHKLRIKNYEDVKNPEIQPRDFLVGAAGIEPAAFTMSM